MDEIERAAISEAGYDPDDPAVVAALDRVRAELAAIGLPGYRPSMVIGLAAHNRAGKILTWDAVTQSCC